MVSFSSLNSLLLQADEVWHPESGNSTRKLKTSASQFSLVGLLSPFSPENQACAVHDASEIISHGSPRLSTLPGSMVGPSNKTLLMPDTTVHLLRTRRGNDVCRSDGARHPPRPSKELERAECSQRIPRLERTALESSAVQSSGRDGSLLDSGFSHTWDSAHESFWPTSQESANLSEALQGHKANDMNSPRQSKSRTQGHRSRSIAIKATPSSSLVSAFQQSPTMDDHQEAESNNEQMYDWATWRMYNRIIDHRRNQQLAMAGTPSVPYSNGYLPTAMGQTYALPGPVPCGSTPTLGDELDGEVFEIDI